MPDQPGREQKVKSGYIQFICHTGFLTAKSQMFQVGDIVETQLSFVVVPLKGKTFKMMTILHLIVLLDRFSQVILTLLGCPEKMVVTGIYQHQTHIEMQSRI